MKKTTISFLSVSVAVLFVAGMFFGNHALAQNEPNGQPPSQQGGGFMQWIGHFFGYGPSSDNGGASSSDQMPRMQPPPQNQNGVDASTSMRARFGRGPSGNFSGPYGSTTGSSSRPFRGDMHGMMGQMGSSSSARGFMMMHRGFVGAISSINGTSLTITASSSTVFTVDASNAKIVEWSGMVTPTSTPTTIGISDLSIGENVMVRGAATGTSITASEIVVGTPVRHGMERPMGPMHGDGMGPMGGPNGSMGTSTASVSDTGFFGTIENFFKKIF